MTKGNAPDGYCTGTPVPAGHRTAKTKLHKPVRQTLEEARKDRAKHAGPSAVFSISSKHPTVYVEGDKW